MVQLAHNIPTLKSLEIVIGLWIIKVNKILCPIHERSLACGLFYQGRYTALMLACANGRRDVVKYLIEQGADVSIERVCVELKN